MADHYQTGANLNRIGKVLIAHPNLDNENPFYKTVIYLYQDDPQQGTIGVILNKKSRYTISNVCAEKNIHFGDTKALVYHGGPVNQRALVLLHTDDWQSKNTAWAGNNLCVSSDDVMMEKLGTGNQPAYWRLFGGMAAWQPGQLDAELSGEWPYRPENSWLVANANEEMLFTKDGNKQWEIAFQSSSQQMFDKYF